jgi:DNA-binding IclR family transcriptional regulator
MEETGLGRQKAYRLMQDLVDEGRLVLAGRGRAARYKAKK